MRRSNRFAGPSPAGRTADGERGSGRIHGWPVPRDFKTRVRADEPDTLRHHAGNSNVAAARQEDLSFDTPVADFLGGPHVSTCLGCPGYLIIGLLSHLYEHLLQFDRAALHHLL